MLSLNQIIKNVFWKMRVECNTVQVFHSHVYNWLMEGKFSSVSERMGVLCLACLVCSLFFMSSKGTRSKL